MTTTVGTSTSYQLTVPELTEAADIQVALKLLSYGISGDPSNDAAIASSSLVGYLKTGLALKSNIASPTFTGRVTLPTGTSSVEPLRFVSGTNLTTAVAGSMEYNGTSLFFTPSGTTRKKITYEEDTGHILLHSGTITYSASGGSGTLVSGRDFSAYKQIKIVFQTGANGGTGVFSIRFNSTGSGYAYTYNNYGSTSLASTSSGTGYNIGNGGSLGSSKMVYVDVFEPSANLVPKHVSWQNSSGFGHGTNNSIDGPITAISWVASTGVPGASWYIYGIK